MSKGTLAGQSGLILAVTILTLTVIAAYLIVGAVSGVGFSNIQNALVVEREKDLNAALVCREDALAAIMANDSLTPAGSFLDPNYDPDTLYLAYRDGSFTRSTSQTAASDCSFDIGARQADGSRFITLVGFTKT